jgi:alpha-amylase
LERLVTQSLRSQAGTAILIALIALLAVGCGSDEAGAPSPAITPNTEGWWRDDVFYEVFVRSFADSNGDGVGDLSGLTANLDVLNDGDPATREDLGVDALWLMPIFPSPSYHGYDVTNYRAVRAEYGTDAEFDAFVVAAHARGIRVVLDIVLNHSSSRHPWFVDSSSGPAAEHRDWYRWNPTNPGWLRPWSGDLAWYASNGAWYYGIFDGAMPDLNLENPVVERELVEAMKFWLARGVDGFRLDAVRYYVESEDGVLADRPETHAFLKRIRAALQRDDPDALLVAEAWAPLQTAVEYYGDGDEVQLAFSFDLASAILASLESGEAGELAASLGRLELALAGKDRGFDAPFLSNHDQLRVLRQLGGDREAARVAAGILFALPGTPFLYYGEELGMAGGAGPNDENKRTPYRWTAEAPGFGFTTASTSWFTAATGQPLPAEPAGTDLASQQYDPGSLWSLYRDLIALRHAEPALSRGTATLPTLTGAPASVFALLREAPEGRVLFVANLGTADAAAFQVAVPAAAAMPLLVGAHGTAFAVGTALDGSAVEFSGLTAQSFVYLSLD